MDDIIVSIDIGTTKVCTLIGKVNKANDIEIIGSGIAPCSGVKKGIIVDIESTSQSIMESVRNAESEAGMKVGSAYINIIGMHIDVIGNKSWLNMSSDNREITKSDVDKLLQEVCYVDLTEDKQIIDVIPHQFIIDGYDEIMDPVGMMGVKLEVEADIIAGKIASVRNIVRSVEKAGLKIDGLIAEAFASGHLLLTPEEREMGTILIDVGGGVTDVSVFKNKRIVFYDSIPVGGDHITNDISIGLKIPYSESEKIKKQYELALLSLIENDQLITVSDINDNKRKSIRVSEVVEVIEARVYEIFSLCNNLIRNSGISIDSGMNVVLTGGGISHIDGNRQLAEEVFGLPARVASLNAAVLEKPEYAVAAGMITYISSMCKKDNAGSIISEQKTNNTEKKTGFFKKIIEFIRSLF